MNLMESLMAQRLAGRSSGGGSDLTPEVKEALLDCFANVAWAVEDGQQYYDALADALYGLQSISAVYTQSGTVYDTDSLDSLKADLVVTALYGDGSTQTVPAASYTLSGSLVEGTSTITVSYGGETATFDVTVSTHILFQLENYAFSSEMVDTQVALLDVDRDFTIALDITLTTNPTSGNGSTPRLIALTNADGSNYALQYGKATASSSTYSISWMGAAKSGIATGVGQVRIVYFHVAGSDAATIKARKGTGTATTTSIDGAYVATSKPLRFGTGTGNNTLPTGTINKAYVYDTVLTDEQIDAFLGL